MEPIRSTDKELQEVLAELTCREPIFHRAEFGTTRADFEQMTGEDFWETGASAVIRASSCWMNWRNAWPRRMKMCGRPANSNAES